MYKLTLRTLMLLVTIALIAITYILPGIQKSQYFIYPDISDKPMTFCNPITITVGSKEPAGPGNLL